MSNDSMRRVFLQLTASLAFGLAVGLFFKAMHRRLTKDDASENKPVKNITATGTQ